MPISPLEATVFEKDVAISGNEATIFNTILSFFSFFGHLPPTGNRVLLPKNEKKIIWMVAFFIGMWYHSYSVLKLGCLSQ